MAPVIRGWARANDLWLRRTPILSRLGSRDATDRDLLADVVAPKAASSEFFLREAIGWALRELAHHDPAWVRSYLANQGDTLSPLSRREASKHLYRCLARPRSRVAVKNSPGVGAGGRSSGALSSGWVGWFLGSLLAGSIRDYWLVTPGCW